MRDPERPLLGELRDEIRLLAAEARESLILRGRLASLELQSDVRLAKRFALALAVGAVMALSVAPVLLVAIAELLDGRLGLPRWAWLAVFGAVLFLGAATLVALAWRRFRRDFTGLEETLAELREDAVWLQDWADRKSSDEERPSP